MTRSDSAVFMAIACCGCKLAVAAALEPTRDLLRDTMPLEQVVVTATRTPQPSFEVPAADSVIDPQQVMSLGVGLGEFLPSMAGVLARDRQNYAQDQQLSIRGFGARAQFGIVGVRLYVDGIPATMPDGQGQATHFNFDSAERIEVLRGPFSVLYGNASGGVVQVFTAPGDGQTEVRATTAIASSNTQRSSINAHGSVAAVAYNLDFTHFSTDGWRAHSAAQRDSGNVRFDIDLSPANRLMVVANRLSAPNVQDNGSLTMAQLSADPQQASPNALQFNTRKSVSQSQLGLIDRQKLSERQEMQLTVYSGSRRVMQVLATPITAQNSDLSPGGVIDLKGRYYGADTRFTATDEWLGRPISIVAGVSYDALNSDRRGYTNFDATAVGVIGELRRDETNRLYNFDQYLQADWSITKQWSMSVGMRHSDVRFDSTDHFVTASNPDDSGSIAFATWSPATSLMYRLNEQLHLYAAYGRGFDTPTFDNLAYRNDGSSGMNLHLQAAHTDNAELGAKWRDQNFNGRVAVFRSNTRDEIAVDSTQGGRSTYRNVGRTQRQGVEAEWQHRLAKQWQTQFAYTWLDASYRDAFVSCVSTACAAGTGVVVPAGNRLPAVPRSAVFAQLQYGGELGFSAALSGNYFSRIAVDDANSQFASAYGILGLSAAYAKDLQPWQIKTQFKVDNIFDRRHVGAVVVNDANARFYQPGAGRTWYMGLSVKWRAQ